MLRLLLCFFVWIGLGSILLAAGCSRSDTLDSTGSWQPAPHHPVESLDGIWMSRSEVKALPTTGPAWEALFAAAQESTRSPDLSDQDDPTNVRVLAKALVFARTGEARYREEVVRACLSAMGTERKGNALSLGRELAAYVIAADLVGLSGPEDDRFRDWLRTVLGRSLRGRSLRSTQEDRPNNWGTHAGASRIAAALYLRDEQELQQAARIFAGYLGDRSAWSLFVFGDPDWQADGDRPMGINPKGARLRGRNVDGVLPDDQRRCCK